MAGSAKPCWIESFVEWTSATDSPELFRYWAAVACVSGLLERRTWLVTKKDPLYPNLFILLVAPPGVGKSQIITRVNKIWNLGQELRVAPSSITRAGLEDFMLEKHRQVNLPGVGPYTFHSVLVASSEFGNLIKEYELDQINMLNQIFDCEDQYEFATRGGGRKKIDAPHLALIAGTQPQYLAHVFPANAYGMGFTSRLIMVYASGSREGREAPDIFGQNTASEIPDALAKAAVKMYEMVGAFTLTEDVKAWLEEKNKKWWEPTPTHPKLEHYITRRTVHILKLTMCFAAAGGRQRLEVRDAEKALSLLLRTEKEMPQIFSAMVTSGVAELNMEFVNFAIQMYVRSGRKPVPESLLMTYMSQKLPLREIKPTIDHMVDTGFLEKKMDPNNPLKAAYIPHGTSSQVQKMMEAEGMESL